MTMLPVLQKKVWKEWLGFVRVGEEEIINENLTLVKYEKIVGGN